MVGKSRDTPPTKSKYQFNTVEFPGRFHDLIMCLYAFFSFSNYASGTGCTRIKIRIMNAGLGDRALFENIVRDFRGEFSKLAQVLQAEMVVAALEYLEAIQVTFDMIREENVSLERELDRHFTNRVSVAVTAGRVNLGRLQNVLV